VSAFDDPDRDLSPERVAEILERGEAQLIDVREPYEYEAGHIKEARHIELEHLASRAGDIDKERPVIFQCRLGARSGMAAQAFLASGYDAYSMAGGLEAWAEKELPLEPEDGVVAEH
jgi:rhodanese-related sulfurtransferase